MKNVKLKFVSVVILIFLSLQVGYNVSTNSQTEILDFLKVINAMNQSEILAHVSFFSSLRTRVTGYEDYYKAADYIYNYFRKLGNIRVEKEYFDVVAPIDGNDSIIVKFENKTLIIRAYSFWPNLIQTCQTPEEGISGKLIYVEKGSMEQIGKLNLNNSIVLMEYNSGKDWVRLAPLVARAIIFIAPSSTNRAESLSKFLLTPVYLPRLYVSREDGLLLKSLIEKYSTVEVTIHNEMSYHKVRGINIIAKINGTKYPNDIIVVTAHYDDWSPVPSVAPGADEAVSISSLLEIAKYYSINPPKRSIWFAVISGHYQALAGARAFVNDYFYSPSVVSGKERIQMMIGLDFSTDSNSVSILRKSLFYMYGSETVQSRWTSWVEPTIFSFVDMLYKQLNWSIELHPYPTSGLRESGWWGAEVIPYMLDTEAISAARGLGFTIRTDRSLRFTWWLPINDFSYLNIENLAPQLYVSLAIIHGFANIEEWKINWDQVKPALTGRARTVVAVGTTDIAGFITVNGKVVQFNVTKGWYEPVGNAFVTIFPNGIGYSSYPFSIIVTSTDENGRFKVYGLGFGYIGIGSYTFLAFKVNQKSKLIDFAPDFGQYGSQFLSNTYSLTTDPTNVTIVVSKCVSSAFFNIYNILGQRPIIQRDPRINTNVWSSSQIAIAVLNARNLAPDISFGYFFFPDDEILMTFTQPKSKFLLTVNLGTKIQYLADNVTSKNLPYDFSGIYTYEEKELHFDAQQVASKDLISTTINRYEEFRRSYVWNPLLNSLLMNATYYYQLVNQSNKYSLLSVLQAISIKGYTAVMGLISDIPDVVLFFMFSAVLFSFFVSSFFSEDLKKLAAYSAIIFSILVGLFYYINPILRLASNIFMSPLIVAVALFFVVVLIIFASETSSTLKRLRTSLLGEHFIERDLSAFITTTFPYSVSQIKKHRFRYILVFLSISSVIFAFTSLTSMSVYQAIIPSTMPTFPAYNGLLLKEPIESQPLALSSRLLEIIGSLDKEATVSIRVWFYPESTSGLNVFSPVYSGSKFYPVRGILGLSTNEVLLENQSNILVKGRWINPEDYFVALVPNELHEALGVSVNDTIVCEGIKLKVIGILNTSKLSHLIDLDGYLPTPIDPSTVPPLLLSSIREPSYTPLPWSAIIVVPSKLAMDMGGYIASIAVKPSTDENKLVISKVVSSFLEVPVYVSLNNKVIFYSSVVAYGGSGFSFAIPLILIGATSVSVALLGSLKERSKELFIYSAVGLSPSDSALILVIESLIISVISMVPAYLIGLIVNGLLIKFGLLPSNFSLNATSSTVVIALLSGFLATLIAMSYPIYLSSRMITPSLERKWKLPTKPKGDEWFIPLPFSLVDEKEVKGVLAYLLEYLNSHLTETPDPFIVRSISHSIDKNLIEANVSLLPLDLGVTQKVVIVSKYDYDSARYNFSLTLQRLQGELETWSRLNYNFIDSIRKQLLNWRFISQEVRSKYVNDALNLSKKGEEHEGK
ncbi:MAG: M28 family peptidase [Thermoproteota archaeon]